MKNIFFICFCALFAFSGCADDDDDLLTGGNVDIDLLPDAKPNDVVDPQVFEAINLNYPDWKKLKNSTRQANIIMQPMLYWNTIEREPMLLIRTYFN